MTTPAGTHTCFPCFNVLCHADLAVLAQMIQGAPTNTATQNAVQNTLQNAPLGLQETPERLVIAASLVAVAVGGYLLRDKLQKK